MNYIEDSEFFKMVDLYLFVVVVNIVIVGFLCYIIIMMNIVIIYVLWKIFLLLKFLKILFLSFVVFDFGVGFLS